MWKRIDRLEVSECAELRAHSRCEFLLKAAVVQKATAAFATSRAERFNRRSAPQPSSFYIEMRSRRIRSITRRYHARTQARTHATASVHGALSAAYHGWWSADKFTALLPVCSERIQNEERRARERERAALVFTGANAFYYPCVR